MATGAGAERTPRPSPVNFEQEASYSVAPALIHTARYAAAGHTPPRLKRRRKLSEEIGCDKGDWQSDVARAVREQPTAPVNFFELDKRFSMREPFS